MAEQDFAQPEVVRAFPTFVWKTRLFPAQRQSINAAIRAKLTEIRRQPPELPRGESWQSGHGLHRIEALSGLVACLERAAAAVLDFLVVRVEEGMLLVFPAWLPHSVDANASDRLRISVSFNLMFSGYAEHLSQPLWGEQ